MSDKLKNLKRDGISIQSHKVKREITQKDLEKDLVKEVGNKIIVKLDDNGKFNN
ncbi:hypothetical protein CLV99_0965 [Sphingobacterium yanglingense]|uniref:Uncharacterized protein n=1 Tax=Sphingobacterium yanglingense TaxID=1437280 RepID=A0A4R6WH76_9SPHI|nr:hypothetical protein CLV99_0965 [Sphingobacterium yanglingense]